MSCRSCLSNYGFSDFKTSLALLCSEGGEQYTAEFLKVYSIYTQIRGGIYEARRVGSQQAWKSPGQEDRSRLGTQARESSL